LDCRFERSFQPQPELVPQCPHQHLRLEGSRPEQRLNPVRKALNDTNWCAGGGAGYDFSNHVSVGLNYDYFDAQKKNVDLSTDMVSVSAEYRF
jgi:opacity protein-like surface antigen